MTSVSAHTEGLLLSIDVGTSGCRAGLYTGDGTPVAHAEQAYTCHAHTLSGHDEQNPEEILQAFVSVVKRVSAGRAQEITRVVMATVLHSLILVDAEGRALTAMVTWADSRSVQQCRRYEQYFHESGWHARTGCLLTPALPLAKLLWYRDHDADLYVRFAKAISIKSYILQRIFGVFLEDHALASATGLFDLAARVWDQGTLDVLGIGVERLPQLAAVESDVPYSYSDFGAALGIPARAVWRIGSGDGQMAHLGTVGYATEQISMTIGTSCAVRRLATAAETGFHPSVWTYALDDCRCLSGMASNNGGNVADWYIRNLMNLNGTWERLADQLAATVCDPELFCFPALFTERLPATAGTQVSGFTGITNRHTTIDLVRAVLEGIAFHVCRMALTVTEGRTAAAVLSGSLTHSSCVQQVIASTLTMPVYAPARSHAPLIGSLRLLGVQLPETAGVVLPCAGSGYAEKFAAWCHYGDAGRGAA